MRLLLYNICYGIGIANTRNLPLHGARYLIGNTKNVTAIANFIDSESPDIVGLIEVDTGSIRTRQTNQAQFIADVLGHYTAYECKYAKHSINQYLPIVRKQSNAFLAEDTVHGERFHYFNKGVKRLIIELEMECYTIFLVHLSLHYKHRQQQLQHLFELVQKTTKPVIVAGDMNTFQGQRELTLFMQAAGLRSANAGNLPSFPSWNPRRELDFILYQDGIDIDGFRIADIQLSDHLPLICDFTVR